MELTVIESNITICPYITAGKKDRRYKTGYSIMPKASASPLLNLRLSNPFNKTRVGQCLMLGKWGTYRVISCNHDDNTMQTIPVQMSYLKDVFSIFIPNKVNVLELGFTVGESTNYSQSKL